MKEQRIVVEIGPDGQITADADGFSGNACMRDLESLLKALASWEGVDCQPKAEDRTAKRTTRRTIDIDRRR